MKQQTIDAILSKHGLPFLRFSEHHVRIDGRLDIFERSRRSGFSYHDLTTDERGMQYDGLEKFVLARIGTQTRTAATKEEFVRALVGIGWERGEAEAEYIKAVKRGEAASRE
jgi:hypothetical protein